MNPKKYHGVQCEHCGEIHEMTKRDALNEIKDHWVCGECGEQYDNEEEAKMCCSEEEL